MAFTDSQAGATISYSEVSAAVLLAGTCSKGDALGFSDGWVRALATAGSVIPMRCVAKEDGVAGQRIQASFGYTIMKGRVTDATAGGSVYVAEGTDSGKYTQTVPTSTGDLTSIVGFALSPTHLLLAPNVNIDTSDIYQVTRTATYVVAASDAPAHVIAQADYVCDGTADDVEIQAAIDVLSEGGVLCLSSGTFTFANPVVCNTGIALKIAGMFARLDRFYLGDGTHPSTGTVICADGVDAFQLGSLTTAAAPFIELENLLIVGKPLSTEPLGGTVYSTGAGIKLQNWIRGAQFKNIHVHRKQYGMQIVPANGKEINSISVNKGIFTFNYWGIYHGVGGWLAYLHLKDIEGYCNHRSLIKVQPVYDLVVDGVDDEASSRYVEDASHDSPVYADVLRDAHFHRISVGGGSAGGVPGAPCVAFGLLELNCSLHSYVNLDDILLNGTVYRGLALTGSDVNYSFNLNGFNIGKHPDETYTYRGGGDTMGSGIAVYNTGVGFIENGEVYATTPIQNLGSGIVKIKNVINYITENSGTATITAAAVTVVVNHGLATTPTRVLVSPTLLSASNKWWVTTLTATQFTINVDVVPGAGTATFDWRAQVGEG